MYLREWRTLHSDLTLEQMVEAIRKTEYGWFSPSIGAKELEAIEDGRAQCPEEILEGYSTVLGCSVAALVCRKPIDPDELWAEIRRRARRRRNLSLPPTVPD